MPRRFLLKHYPWFFAPLMLGVCPVPVYIHMDGGTFPPVVIMYLLGMAYLRDFAGVWMASAIVLGQLVLWMNLAIVLPLGLRYLCRRFCPERWQVPALALPLVILLGSTFVPVHAYHSWTSSTGTYTFWQAAKLWVTQDPARTLDWHRPQDW